FTFRGMLTMKMIFRECCKLKFKIIWAYFTSIVGSFRFIENMSETGKENYPIDVNVIVIEHENAPKEEELSRHEECLLIFFF
ncbi:hypothetical protein L9F63_007926, partial [Diploptera punctata]